MLILSKSLTISQITFIFRMAIQILAFGGTFLIGLIIFGNSPRSTAKETHDLLNRVVGKSTATLTSVKWMQRQMFQTSGDRQTPRSLLFGLLLFILYGLFVSLSDIGFLGLHACNIPFPPFHTLPASIQTEADARALVQKNLVNGTDPKLVKFVQCDPVGDGPGFFNLNMSTTPRICSQWRNTTYDDSSLFRSLNLTDTDVLMHKNLGVLNTTALFYYFGPSDHAVLEPTISDGLAILPHETGVQLVVGAPTLSKNQVVEIPKTMAVEITIGCLPVGLVGNNDPTFHQEFNMVEYEWFIPDSIYKPIQRSMFSGPEYLFGPLQIAADAIRTLLQPNSSTSIVNPDTGYTRSFNQTRFLFSPMTTITPWGAVPTEACDSIVDACSMQVLKAVNSSVLSHPQVSTLVESSGVCVLYELWGSWAKDGEIHQARNSMICATTTAFNMVSADLEMDTHSRVTGRLTRLPSDLNINVWPDIQRYTLSDNPSGDLQHFVYQDFSTAFPFTTGAGSPGHSLAQMGAAMTQILSRSMHIINGTGLSWNQSNATTLTKWVSGYGASFLLTCFGMNGWAALDKPPLTIRSTGGMSAVCYTTPYLTAFVPLIVAALVVVLWNIQLWISSRLRDAKKWENLYGGLVPKARLIGTQSSDTILLWVDDDDAVLYLRPLKDDDSSGESET